MSRITESNELIKRQITSHSEKLATHEVKIVQVEHNLSDVTKAISQLNPNHEAKQSVSGFGVVSLPENAANSPLSVVVKGRSLKNELNYNRETWAEWTKSEGVAGDSTGLEFTALNGVNCTARLKTSAKVLTKYGILYYVVSSNLVSNFIISPSSNEAFAFNNIVPKTVGNQKAVLTSQASILINRITIATSTAETTDNKIKIKDIRIFELPTGSEIESDFTNLTADQLAAKYPYIKGDSTKSTLGGRIQIKDGEDNITGEAYYNGTLRSLPNGTNDEVSVTEGKETQRVSEPASISGTAYASIDTTTYTNVDVVKTTAFSLAQAGTTAKDGMTRYYDKNGVELTEVAQADIDLEASAGKYYWHTDKALWVIVAKGTYADIAAARTGIGTTTLTYQLANPIETTLPAQILTGGANQTVWLLPEIADAGIYTDKITVLNQDLPIKLLLKVSKIDFETGAETALNVATAVIAGDKKSFTHPDLKSGDIVFFEYEYPSELTTTGELTIGYLDSRYVVKGADDNYYTWHVAVDAEGKATLVAEVVV